LLEARFDPEELKKLIRQELTMMEMWLLRGGNYFATLHAGATVSAQYQFKDLTRGLQYLDFLKHLCKDLDNQMDVLTNHFHSILGKLLRQTTFSASLTGSREALEAYVSNPLTLPAEGAEPHTEATFTPVRSLTAKKISGGVAYNAMVVGLRDANVAFNGKMLVLSNILTLDYLWNRVRMRGGAYGVSARFDMEGILRISSYRDPNVALTYQNYRDIPSYLRSFEADESEMTKYIIGTFSDLDAPLRPKDRSIHADMYALSGVDDAYRQEIRDAVLETTAADIRAFAEPSERLLALASCCTFGSSDKIDADQALFETIQ
jgi:hypothetical protein